MQSQHWVSLSSVAMLLFLATTGKADDRELLGFLVEANKNNRDQITSGIGRGTVFFSREINHDKVPYPLLKSPKQSGVKISECQWYLLGDKTRSDLKSLSPKEGEKIMGGEYRQYESREAWMSDKRIEYRLFADDHSDAYIREPIKESSDFILGSAWRFSPKLIFDIYDLSVEQWIAEMEEGGSSVTVTEEGPAGHKIYTIKSEGSSSGITYRVEIKIAEDQGFNVVSLESYNSDLGDQPFIRFAATYVDGGTNGKVFYPNTYHYKFVDDIRTEELNIDFHEIQLNLSADKIDEQLFTLNGLGIKTGTRVYDMRYGEPIQLYYGGLPVHESEALIEEVISERMRDIGATIPPPATTTLPAHEASEASPTPTTTAPAVDRVPEWRLLMMWVGVFLSVVTIAVIVWKRRRRIKQ